MANPKPLQLPGRNYSESEETLFRSKLESQLLELERRVEEAERRDGTVSSLASKRNLYMAIPTGQTEVGGGGGGGGTVTEVTGGDGITVTDTTTTPVVSITNAPAYGSFNKSWSPPSTVSQLINLSAVTWFPKPTAWTENLASGWREKATSTGTFEYFGDYPASGTRRFVVNWGINLWYYVPASYVALAGRLVKNSTEIAGSAQVTSWDHYLLYLGNYYYIKYVAGTAMVEVETGDTIHFEYGFNSTYGVSTATLVAYNTYESGATVNIMALD